MITNCQACQTCNRTHEGGKEWGVWSTLAMEEGTFWYEGEKGLEKKTTKTYTNGWINGNSR